MTFLGFEIAFLDIMQLDTHFFPDLFLLNSPHCYVAPSKWSISKFMLTVAR